jgi:hypothetical protein
LPLTLGEVSYLAYDGESKKCTNLPDKIKKSRRYRQDAICALPPVFTRMLEYTLGTKIPLPVTWERRRALLFSRTMLRDYLHQAHATAITPPAALCRLNFKATSSHQSFCYIHLILYHRKTALSSGEIGRSAEICYRDAVSLSIFCIFS